MRVGVAPQIITYVNNNGYEVFAGYRYGILGTDRYKKRFQNEVKFRGISRNRDIVLDAAQAQEKIEKVIPLSVTVENMKENYQDPEMVTPDHEAEFLKSLETLKPLPRATKATAYKSVLNRNTQKSKVNKFERRSGFGRKIIRNPYNRNMDVIRIKFANGTSAKIERMMR